MEGKFCNHVISILVDPSSNYSNISPKLVEKCKLAKDLHGEPWLIQLTMGKR